MNATLLRLGLRQVRLRLVLWPLGGLVLALGGISGYQQLYPTAAQRAALVRTADVPALRTIYGVPHDLTTNGAFTFWRYGTIIAVLVGLFALLTVVKLTRAEEESGRRELVWAAPLARTAPLAAGVAVATVGCLLTGLLTMLGMLSADGAGAVVFGAGVAAVGLVFVGVGAIAAQVASTARAAAGLAGAVLAVAYGLRAAADGSADRAWMSWLTPIGWFQRIRAYDQNAWTPVALLVAAAVVLVAVALAAERNRDMLAGLLGVRPGPPRSRWLTTPEALAARLQWGTAVAWIVVLAVVGGAFGGMSGDFGAVLQESGQQMNQMFARIGGSNDLSMAFLGAIFSLVDAAVAATAALCVLTARREEAALRAEPVMARGVGRVRWLGSHLLVGLAAAVLTAAVGGATMAATAGASGVSGVPRIFLSGLNALPVTLLFAGLAVFAIAVVPRQANTLTIGVLGAAILLSLFGAVLNVPDGVLQISPFHHVALMPAADFDIGSSAVLAAIGVVLAAVGLFVFARRDVTTAGA
ncbi:MAG TPA: hypothetical protein VGL93_05220 [Streptosporangiaceae bacterium]|jgi:ABC-2 type transport system permease protein